MQISYLSIVSRVSLFPLPSTYSNIGQVIKLVHECFKVRITLGRVHSHYVSSTIEMERLLDFVLRNLVGRVPCFVESLHECRMTFDRLWVADLHDGHVATCTSDVADIEEVVATEPFLGNLGLFALMAVVDCDDGSGRSIRGVDLCSFVALDNDVVVVVPAVDLKLLVMRRLVMDCKSVRHDCCVDLIEVKWMNTLMVFPG